MPSEAWYGELYPLFVAWWGDGELNETPKD